LWLRFNLVPQFWRIVPYAQAGAGVTFTDIDRKIVGQTFNFNLNLGAGFRWFFARNWSVNLEHRSQERRYQFTGTDARNFVLLLTGVANYFAGSVSTAVSSSCSLMTGAMA